MAMPGRTAMGRIRDEGGFTLPELLVATVLSMIVIGAGVTVFTVSLASQARVSTQSTGIQQARTTMERITRELRQGSSVPSASPSQLSVITNVRDSSCGTTTPVCQVTYACSDSGTCTRTVSAPDGTSPGAPVQLISGLSGNDVFTYTAPTTDAPASVGVTLSIPGADGSNAITLTDAATLRNPGGP